jgi:RNA polymerase sigma-70 factor (ECF subfamily)
MDSASPADARPELEAFLASVEGRAFRMAQLATGNREDALDIVQDAMLALVQKYARQPEAAWRAVFYRILQNRIRDWHRRQQVRRRWRRGFGAAQDEGANTLPAAEETLPDPDAPDPADRLIMGRAWNALEKALQTLPLRQQQAFLLRAWEGLDLKATAVAMQCSTGSVKTHYHRALQTLRRELEDHWP